jgi:hypothetical protein
MERNERMRGMREIRGQVSLCVMYSITIHKTQQ